MAHVSSLALDLSSGAPGRGWGGGRWKSSDPYVVGVLMKFHFGLPHYHLTLPALSIATKLQLN